MNLASSDTGDPMTRTALIAADLVAIAILTFGLYFPRHRRRDMLVAYLVANIGVLAVADALASAPALGTLNGATVLAKSECHQSKTLGRPLC